MDIFKAKNIHFTGIKGVGMTALALCAQDLGIKVTGSDVAEIFVTDETLSRRGIKWRLGFGQKNLDPKPDLVVTTGAHGGLANPEVLAARKMDIPVMTHAEALVAMTQGKEVIAVCGVGGKSTTAAMIATIFDFSGLHPSFAIGVGNIPSLGSPGRYDKRGKVFIVEADEYAVSPGVDNRPRFSLFTPRVIVVTNIEYDHPDIYPTIDDTKKAFREFFKKIPKDGLLVANKNNQNVMDVVKDLNLPVKTYGFPQQEIKLNVPGKFNLSNAAAAAVVANFYGIKDNKIQNGLKRFSGTRRRFEKAGEIDGIIFFDDYAHHPTEIQATLTAAREWFPKYRIVTIFQPHTYSRTKALFSEFAKSFKDADLVAIMDIYASARETQTLGMSGELLAREVGKFHKNAFYTGGHETTAAWIKKYIKKSDIVLTLGAGDIFLLYQKLINGTLFSSLTTLRIGGPIKYFATAGTEEEIFQLIERAKAENMPFIVIGGGTNLLVSDEGFDGFVIQNLFHLIKIHGEVLEVSSGTDLQELVWWANKAGITGFEKLAGIPGSVGGAVYGNAGAYGQTISDNILWVEIFEPRNGETKKLNKQECNFTYRESRFKKTKEIILKIGFSIARGDSKRLSAASHEIIETRMGKYPPGIACPGSFFKNVEVDSLDKKILSKIPKDKIIFGKIPAGWLLERVGAKGARKNGVEITPWHANLFVNKGGGRASDFLYLAKKYKKRIKERFGIELEPEVQLIGFEKNLF